MRVNFRQGIVSHQTGTFLSINGSGHVDLLAVNRPFIVNIAHKTTNYIHSEDNTFQNAWTGPFTNAVNYWLYIDFNPLTFERAFGISLLEPIAQSAEPQAGDLDSLSIPILTDGRHWYDTATNTHFVRNGSLWSEVVRIFVAHLLNGVFSSLSINSPLFTGTQIGNTNSVLSGRVLFDESMLPQLRDDRTFLTTEDQFFTNQSRTDGVRLESNVSKAQAKNNTLAAFTVVSYSGDGEIDSAQYTDTGSTILGLLTENLIIGEVGSVVLQGVVTNPAWTWLSVTTVGAEMWADNGLLVTIDPHIADPITYPQGMVPVARVLSDDTIIFEQGLGGKGDKGATGSIANFPPATTVDIGGVTLVTASSDAGQAFVISDTDSRLIDSRNPLPHNHAAIDITYVPGTGMSALDTQTAIDELATEKFNITGGTLTGVLVLDADPINSLEATTKQYVDAITDALATEKVNLTGGTMTGVLVLAADPANPLEAATKQYVDAITLDVLDDVVLTSPSDTQVLTFNGGNWVNATATAFNWLIANNGVDFTTAPSAVASNGIAIGDSATASTVNTDTIAIGTNAIATGIHTIAIGMNANANSTRSICIGYGTINSNNGVAIGDNAAGHYDGIAIGHNSKCNNSEDIAIGKNANTQVSGGSRNISIGDGASSRFSSVALGYSASATQTSSIAIGRTANCTGVEAIVIGRSSSVTGTRQVGIGYGVSSTSVTSDVDHSVKLGRGDINENKNLLHLFSKGKLELYGDEAQFILPNYATAGIPVTTVVGGLIYDTDTSELKVYDGGWNAISGGSSNNWLIANNGVDFTTAPTAAGSNSIALGNNSSSIGISSIAIGSNANTGVGSVNSIVIGNNTSVSTFDSCVVVGPDATASAFNQTVIGPALTSADVTSDVAYSLKIGCGTFGQHNFLHLHTRGHLEIIGDQAQMIIPKYATASEPITPVEGSLIYDSTLNVLKAHDGSSWNKVNGGDIEITSYSETANVIATTGAVTIDVTTGTYFYNTTTTGAITFTFSNPAVSGRISTFTLEFVGGATNAPVWPASVKWPSGTEPTWTTGIDVVSFSTRDNGTTWLGMLGGTAFA